MTSPQARKGHAAERDVARWLGANGWPYAQRAYGAGRQDDIGDITGLGPGVVIEVKNARKITLSAWLHELATEMENADAETGVVIAKRAGTLNVGDWYAVMPVSLWADLMREAGR